MAKTMTDAACDKAQEIIEKIHNLNSSERQTLFGSSSMETILSIFTLFECKERLDKYSFCDLKLGTILTGKDSYYGDIFTIIIGIREGKETGDQVYICLSTFLDGRYKGLIDIWEFTVGQFIKEGYEVVKEVNVSEEILNIYKKLNKFAVDKLKEEENN